jgi:hypothetical protein
MTNTSVTLSSPPSPLGGRTSLCKWIVLALAASLGLGLACGPADAQKRGNGLPTETSITDPRDRRNVPPPLPIAPQENACSAAYHTELSTARQRHDAALGNAHNASRVGETQLPGRWLLSADLFPSPKKKAMPKPERVCAEPVRRGGRTMCAKWELKAATPVALTEVKIDLKPTAGELASLKFLNDFVTARAAIPEVGNNGRYNWLVARVASDLRSYLSQPPHPALCSGASQMLDFYQGQLAPLIKRMADVDEQKSRIRSQLAIRLSEISKQTTGLEILQANASDADLVVALAGRILADSPLSSVSDEPTPLKRLDKIKSLLLDQMNALAPTEQGTSDTSKAKTSETVSPVARDEILAALRVVEAGVYAEMFDKKFTDLKKTLNTAVGDIRRAHAASCTCRD